MEFYGHSINPLAIGLSAVAAFLLGYLWYGMLFEAQWVAGHGFTPEQMEQMAGTAPVAMGVSFIGYLVTATALSIVFSHAKVTDLTTALCLTTVIWFGFPAMMILMNSLYAGGSMTIYLIDSGYQLLYSLVMACIINWMP